MRLPSKARVAIINLLVSLAISLLVNFSQYIMFIGAGSTSGRPFHPTAFENPTAFLAIQTAYYFLLAFALVSLATAQTRSRSRSSDFARKLVWCLLLCGALYFFTPVGNRQGEVVLLLSYRRLLNPMVMLKSSFTLIVALLYGKIYELVYQKQHMELENELLKNENLETKYNMLVSQINPHFLFNSLNSLSMLVRERHNDKALGYIDQLSDTFRYILQNGQQGLTTLREELKFLDAFRYLHEVRYFGKLFFDIAVDPEREDWLLPSLTLQPLVENAVKHNSITRTNPFHITIRTEGDLLVISNPVIPKMGDPEGTGIGLKNLSSRYQLLTGQDIVVERDGATFAVKLPLIRQS